MTAILVLMTRGTPQAFPRVMWACAWIDIAFTIISIPSNLVWLFGLK